MTSPTTSRILVLGLGNRILCDDAIGLMVADQLTPLLAGRADVLATEESGLALLDLIVGYDRLLIVDAILRGNPPGTLLEFDLDNLDWACTANPHATGIPEVIELGRSLGQKMPTSVRVLAIEVAEPYTIREGLTPVLTAALPEAVRRALELVDGWSAGGPRTS
jgi:hydrogenase maturation protease